MKERALQPEKGLFLLAAGCCTKESLHGILPVAQSLHRSLSFTKELVMKLEGNTVLITGGTSGIGRALAAAFLKEGSRVIICGRRAERLKALAQMHPNLVTRVCDVSRAHEREELVGWTTTNFPDTNILINNAGVQLTADLTRPVDLRRIYEEVDTNLIAPLHLGSLMAPHLSARPEAAIVNISSGLAFTPLAFMPVYCATKAAIHSLTLSLRYQLRHTAVKVFEIAPPSVDTELGHDRRADKSESHGGIPVSEFLAGALDALRDDQLEAPIGMARNLWEKRDALFGRMNP